jgi:uncharacterized repeat protein (TIGR03803 family)
LYGVTSQGGSSASCFNGCGTVFSISLTGSFATLCSFSDSNGSRPTGIVPGNDGNFYGATASGGSGTNCVSGCGTVFRVTAGGTLTTLYSFEGSDGQTAALGIQGRDDDFYGFTASGGSNSVGTLFRISPSGSLTTLYSFKGSDGGSPTSIVQGSDGAFYGTTGLGGTNNHGTVFKLTVPTSAAQHQITGIQLSETNVIITLSTVAGAGYQLQSKDVLSTGAWSNVGASITSAGGALIVTNVGGAFFTQRFYRFSITP